MPNLTFDFTWYKHSAGYQLVTAKPVNVKRKPGQSMMDASLDKLADDVQPPPRIVGKGRLVPNGRPLRIANLFERFANIKTENDVLSFVEKYGPLTYAGLRGKGDVVWKLIDEARDMRSRVRKSLGKLIVSIDTMTRGEMQLRVRPACLLDAIWLQYAQAGAYSRQCPQCDEWFLVGAGRRRDAQFCSDECRKRYNSLKRSRR